MKASISTPNLRSMFGMKSIAEKGAGGKSGNVTVQDTRRGEQKHAKLVKTQYAAETWCDALMFPRPRFRAHVITPPSSPEEAGKPSVGLKEVARAEKLKSSCALTVPLRSPPQPVTLPTSSQPLPDFLVTQRHPLPKVSSGLSFAKDNVARNLPNDPRVSPTKETILRVVAEGERRDQEREKWNELARSSFQNRRSRSLSRTRTRKKSGEVTAERERLIGRARVGSDVGMRRPRTSDEKTQVLSRTLTTLAAEAFRQPTPTISTVSHGAELKTHSRRTSESAGHKHGHTRNTSWGKVALKQLCTSEEDAVSDVAVSPEDMKQEKLEGALMHQNTAKMRVRGRKEEAEEADVQFLDIVPLPPTSDRKLNETQSKLPVAERDQRSNSQSSNVSDSLDAPTIGIALSTPPDPSPVDELPDLSAHPYAQSPIPRFNTEPVPVSAPYAGPHPTSLDYNRHRLPPHPPPDNKPPGQHMYAISQSGSVRQVSTPEILQPSKWERSSSVGPSPYAYANVAADEKRESTLGVEEVLLSPSFRQGGSSSRDIGLGSDDVYENQGSFSPREPSSPPSRAVTRVHRKHVAQIASGIPSLSHTVTPATHTDVLEPGIVQHGREVSTALSSPSSQGSGSSRMSPRPLGSIDDLEHFRDLFYRPGRSGSETAHARTSSSEGRKMLGSRDVSFSWGDDRIKSSEGLNGLRGLARQFSEDYNGFPSESNGGDRTRDSQLDRHSPTLPGLNDESLQIGTPLRAEYEEGQDFPEDIQSSRASSFIEHESIEGMLPQKHLLVLLLILFTETLRLGAVSLSTAEPTHQIEQRQSTLLSFGDTEDSESTRPNRDTIFTATSSQGIPGNVDDLLRTSFVTTSSASQMTNIIGDFPAPPAMPGVILPVPAATSLDHADFKPGGPGGPDVTQSPADYVIGEDP